MRPLNCRRSPKRVSSPCWLAERRLARWKSHRTRDGYSVDFEFRNNGRGPTLTETVTLDENGLPVSWVVSGNTTFGNAVDESYDFVDNEASWTDTTGSDQAVIEEGAFYVPQNASPYWLAIAARALMADGDGVLPAIPGGELRMSEIDRQSVTNGPIHWRPSSMR